MKTLASTAPVLDEADEFSRKLDWILFKAEMDHIWGGFSDVPWNLYAQTLVQDPDQWVPGYPLYLHPGVSRDTWAAPRCSCIECSVDGYGAEWLRLGSSEVPRSMVDIFDEFDFYEHCEDCEVSWEDPEELNCWMCGEQKKLPRMKVDLKPHYSPIWDGFTTFTTTSVTPGQFVGIDAFVGRINGAYFALGSAADRSAERIRALYSWARFLDEVAETRSISRDQRLDREDMIDPPNWDEFRHFSWEVSNNTDDLEELSVRERALWARQNPSHAQFSRPITEQRRRRNE